MYKIYFADLGKATGDKEIGKRPVVSVGMQDGSVKVYKITSRNRNDHRHIRVDSYVVSGFCDISQSYIIDKKFLIGFKRDCTTGEINRINAGIRKFSKNA